jgi:hypothetical protein
MALSIIGAGFGRTGTLSLKLAIEQLGLGPCHHMEEVLKSPAQLVHWQAVAARRPVDWDAVYAGFHATVDWPGAHVWRELAAHYPAAKVILTVRPEAAWWNSFAQTIKLVVEGRDHIPNPQARGCMEMGHELIFKQGFGGRLDEVSVLSAYRRRIEEVRAAIPADRLLVFNVTEGWAPLCGFLGVPVPATVFPRTNSTKEFWEVVRSVG